MKYLVLDTHPKVAIPLEAIAAGAHELKFLDLDWKENQHVYYYADSQRVSGEIVDSSEIQPPKKEVE